MKKNAQLTNQGDVALVKEGKRKESDKKKRTIYLSAAKG